MPSILAPDGRSSQCSPRVTTPAGDTLAGSVPPGGGRVLWRCLLVGFLALALSIAASCARDPEARRQQVRSLQEAGDFASTLDPLRELLEQDPEDPELNHLYGVALMRTRQPEL